MQKTSSKPFSFLHLGTFLTKLWEHLYRCRVVSWCSVSYVVTSHCPEYIDGASLINWTHSVYLCSRLDANHISSVPAGCFFGMRSLRHLWLDDNALTEVPVEALSNLPALQAMTLALNHISHVPDHAFSKLGRLVVLYVQHTEHTLSS